MADPIALTGRLDLAAAGPLYAQLTPITGTQVVLDMSGVTHIGALCFQTLIATARACAQDGGALELTNPSEQILAQLKTMGSSPEQIMKGHV